MRRCPQRASARTAGGRFAAQPPLVPLQISGHRHGCWLWCYKFNSRKRENRGHRPRNGRNYSLRAVWVRRIRQAKRSFEDGRQARYSLHRAFKQIEPKHRTAQCLWSVVSAEKTVQVMLDQEHNRARYNNLRVCGRVWPCPFCSAKISERRALELAGAMAVAKAKGLRVALLTCTVPTSFRTA